MSTTATAFPPLHSHPSRSISASTALTHLQSYLSLVPTTPYLLPNAKLNANGPSAQSTSYSVILHNLQRVEAGLRGEWLAPVLDLEEEMGGAGVAALEKDGVVNREDQEDEEGWQELEEYQREQSIEVGDLGRRETGVAPEDEDAGQPMDIEVPEKVKTKTKKATETTTQPKKIDKEARKREKKERLKEEKKKKMAKAAAK